MFINPFSEELWSMTYKHHSDTTIYDTWKRVAADIASVEQTKELQDYWSKQFYKILSNNFAFVPGGRIISNAGTEFKGTSYLNCFVGSRPDSSLDSISGIYNILLRQAETLKSEGGWGMNFSFIRPRGSFITGVGVESPGAVKFMELFDRSSDIITAGSSLAPKHKRAKKKIRKGAQMGVLDCWHPDIREFITAKQTDGRLSKFNMSVNCSNQFMDKVLEAKELLNQGKSLEMVSKLIRWQLVFPDTTYPDYNQEWDGNLDLWLANDRPVIVYEDIPILELWDLITTSTYNRNEPGVLFLDRANETHCWNYGGPTAHIAATNPCGEQTLPFSGVCLLGSLNLTMFVIWDEDSKSYSFNLQAFSEYVSIATRFLDNVNDATTTPLPDYTDYVKKRRRIGLGIMGWGSLLYLLKLRFGSDDALRLQELIMKILTHTAVKTSVNLAKEKGMFIGCDPDKHADHPFFKTINLPAETIEDMRRYGIRNSALFSIQPTGNTGILANNVSGGLEPIFMPEYIRTVIVNSVPEELIGVCPKWYEGEFKETSVFKFTKEGGETILKGKVGKTTFKIDKNRGLTKEVLCQDYAVAILSKQGLWDPTAEWAVSTTSLSVTDHLNDMKGFAKYMDSSISKTINLPNNYPFVDFEKVYLDAYNTGYIKGVTTYRDGTMTSVLSSVTQEPEDDYITKTKAPSRPELLECDIYHPTYKGVKYYCIVGKLNNEPYEVFVGPDKENSIPLSAKCGYIKKIGSGHYSIVIDDNSYPIVKTQDDESVDIVTRLCSTSLRHGADIVFIVEQLEKTQGSLMSFSKVLARTLKRYIPNGTVVEGIVCPNCGSNHFVRQEGCKLCHSCGFSACT